MTDEQFLDVDGRPTVRVVRRYPHPIETVWRAVTTPEALRVWFPSPVELELRPGGAMRFTAFADGPSMHGTVEEVDAPRLLVFRWGTDRLTFELGPEGAGTRFVLTHSFDDRYGAPSFGTGWAMCLGALRASLAGEPPRPPDRGVRRHEELVREFGLDRPVSTPAASGWSVRVERQLTCPAEVARELWQGLQSGDDGSLSFDLHEGTGHGARLVLAATGTDPADRRAAESRVAGAAGALAQACADWAVAHSG